MKNSTNKLPTVIHIGIQVADLDKAADFYKVLFDLKKVPILQGSLGPMGFIKLGQSEFVLHHIPGDKVKERNKLDHFGIEVDDIEKVYKQACKMGVNKGGIHKSFSWYQFNVVDTDGIHFHVMTRKKVNLNKTNQNAT